MPGARCHRGASRSLGPLLRNHQQPQRPGRAACGWGRGAQRRCSTAISRPRRGDSPGIVHPCHPPVPPTRATPTQPPPLGQGVPSGTPQPCSPGSRLVIPAPVLPTRASSLAGPSSVGSAAPWHRRGFGWPGLLPGGSCCSHWAWKGETTALLSISKIKQRKTNALSKRKGEKKNKSRV